MIQVSVCFFILQPFPIGTFNYGALRILLSCLGEFFKPVSSITDDESGKADAEVAPYKPVGETNIDVTFSKWRIDQSSLNQGNEFT